MLITPPLLPARYRITVIRPRVRFRLFGPRTSAPPAPILPAHWRNTTPLMQQVLQSAVLGVIREDDTCFDFYKHFRCPDRVHKYLMKHGQGLVSYQKKGIWHVLPGKG